MDLENLYQEIILDHYKRPRGKGLRDPYAVEVHHVNPTCGDEITLRVVLDGDRVADVSYEGQGCSISQASASVLFEQLVGQSVEDDLATSEAFLELMQGRGVAGVGVWAAAVPSGSAKITTPMTRTASKALIIDLRTVFIFFLQFFR